jgi:hypothetical protein
MCPVKLHITLYSYKFHKTLLIGFVVIRGKQTPWYGHVRITRRPFPVKLSAVIFLFHKNS